MTIRNRKRSFDFVDALEQYTESVHTRRIYYRWIDSFWAYETHEDVLTGDARLSRLRNLSAKNLRRILRSQILNNWLHSLEHENTSRQALDQAYSSVVTLARLFADQGYMSAEQASEICMTHVPAVKPLTPTYKLLTVSQIRRLISASFDMATSQNQAIRNRVVTTLLSTMLLRRDELAALAWIDFKVKERQGVLRLPYAESFTETIVPKSVFKLLIQWKRVVGNSAENTPLIRRVWKGGRISDEGLSADGIWLIVHDAARHAELGVISPEDLRYSVVACFLDGGFGLDEVHRLLRHKSMPVTEQFIERITDQRA